MVAIIDCVGLSMNSDSIRFLLLRAHKGLCKSRFGAELWYQSHEFVPATPLSFTGVPDYL